MNREPAIEVKNLFYKYPGGDYIFRGAYFEVLRGEHVLVIGDTGSGKSTLVRILSRTAEFIYRGELSGEIRILGKNIGEIGFEELQRLVHVIGQNPYLYFTEHVVRDELYSYALKIYKTSEKAERAVRKVVEATHIYNLVDKYFYELSGGEAKRVIVARALIAEPEILLFDEPLMWLDDRGVSDFLDLLKLLRYLGRTVLVFEHRFLPIIREFDRVFLLKNGRIYDVSTHALNVLKETPDPDNSSSTLDSRTTGREIVKTVNIEHGYNGRIVLKNINLSIKQGDLVLIYGLNGTGKTTLLKILAGYLKPKKGRVERKGRILYIPQNTLLFFTEETVRKEIEMICKTWKKNTNCIEKGLELVSKQGIPLNRSPFTLSHGQMVKLAIIISGLAGADLVLLDEPFAGLTYSDRLSLLEYMLSMRDKAFILATSTIQGIGRVNWTQAYKLEDGALYPFDFESKTSLKWASLVYEAIKNGVGD